jgi:hypothetical protein
MNNASTPDGRGHDRPNDAEPFFPSEGTFNPVVPLSEIGRAPVAAPLPRVDPADVGRPAEAAWARAAHRAGRKEEEETTLVPSRAGGAQRARRPWVTTAAVIALSVAAGLASGTYLIWSSQRAPARVAAEAPTLPPAPVTDATPAPVAKQEEAVSTPEKVNEATKDEKPVEVAHAPKPETPARTAPVPRAERPARAAAEAGEITPEPKPARSQSAASTRPRPTTVVQQTPKAPSSERPLPISSPPPAAKSKKVIQWP